MDYYELGEFWKTELEPLLDHQFLNDTLLLDVTTAECIASWVLGFAKAKFGTIVKSVTVSETPNTRATVYNNER